MMTSTLIAKFNGDTTLAIILLILAILASLRLRQMLAIGLLFRSRHCPTPGSAFSPQA